MKKIFRGAVVLLILITFCFLTPLVSKAEGMEVSPDKTTVKPGDTITVTVSFSGTDIWFAKVTISCDGAIVQGNGTYLIEPDRGQKEVSDSFLISAVAPGDAVITVEGVTDEDESVVYTSDFSVTVTGEASPGRQTGTGGGAVVDENQKDPEGQYINRRPPEEAPGTQEITTKPEKKPETQTKKTTEPESSPAKQKASGNGTKSKEKNKTKTLVIILASAIVFVLAASMAAVIVIRKKLKTIEEAEQEEHNDRTTDSNPESDNDLTR